MYMYTGDGDDTSDQELFVVELKAFNGLFFGPSPAVWILLGSYHLSYRSETLHEYCSRV